VDADCWFNSLYIRAVPSHAIELAAVYLDRSVAAVLAYAPDMKASPQEKQDLAAFIHLCGAGPARAFVRRGFQVMAGERCGDHLVTTYLAKVNAMKRQFLRLAVQQPELGDERGGIPRWRINGTDGPAAASIAYCSGK
jgi:hypothetical protein